MRIFLFLFVFITQFSFAQDRGYIKYDIEVIAIDTARKLVQQAAMMEGSFMEIFFTKTKVKLNFKTGALYRNTVIRHLDSSLTITLSESPYGKYAQYTKDTEILEADTKEDVVQVDSSDFVVINGYKCFKVNAVIGGALVTYYCTNEISPNVDGLPIIHPKIPGFPVKFSKVEGGIKMTYEMSEDDFGREIPETLFPLTIPLDYKLMAN